MAFNMRPTSDLIQIAAAGGGLVLEAALRSPNDLIQIAAAAANSGARIVLTGMSMRSTMDLVRIAAAGRGCVQFTD